MQPNVGSDINEEELSNDDSANRVYTKDISIDVKSKLVWVKINGSWIGYEKSYFMSLIEQTKEYKEAVIMRHELIGRP